MSNMSVDSAHKEGSIQRLSSLLVLPEDSTEEDLRRCLEKYVPKELVSDAPIAKLGIVVHGKGRDRIRYSQT